MLWLGVNSNLEQRNVLLCDEPEATGDLKLSCFSLGKSQGWEEWRMLEVQSWGCSCCNAELWPWNWCWRWPRTGRKSPWQGHQTCGRAHFRAQGAAVITHFGWFHQWCCHPCHILVPQTLILYKTDFWLSNRPSSQLLWKDSCLCQIWRVLTDIFITSTCNNQNMHKSCPSTAKSVYKEMWLCCIWWQDCEVMR